MAHHLLGRHVPRRADRKPDRGEVRRLAGAAGQPEIGQHRAAVGMDEDVGGLEVAVDDAGVMRVLQAISDLAQISPRRQGVEWAPVQDVAQRAAADQRHREVRHAIGKLEVVYGQDVRVVQLGERLRLGLEPLHKAVVLKELWRQRLERDLATERLLHRAVDHRHAAAAQAFDDLVAADPGAG